ncbi:ATP-dependent RNA helicase HrpA [Baekduia soli]|uniref:ATP-dependent RNA helicase HrpA n=1 Tax=Baekduia soli TaxID=496014 RepID=A0A5B8U9G1_9ACTN|nr:ATP-dependent RNA helicase HrpA [Baekduia soli]QEC49704.1 ATP-dependent RNA helicase HrpA [Baekduia soli]
MSAPPAPAGELRPRLAALTLRDEHRLRRRLDRVRRTRDDDARTAALRRLEEEIGRAEAHVARRRAAVPAVSYPPQLPVSARRDDLLAAIAGHQVVIVAGETGSGKTTQLPKMCLELGRGVRGTIAHTQPRRLAARTVAQRIADELEVALGEAVGYSVRFTDRSQQDTLVRLMTDGLLLAEVGRDPLLRRYDTIIIDEAHERSLNIDFLLGYLREILPRRPDLKVLITSATIDPERFSAHFGDAPIVEVSGRTFPVEVRYRPLAAAPAANDEDDVDGGGAQPDRDPTEAIGDAVDELLGDPAHPEGDVLVFLSGEREIRDTADALAGRLPDDVEILPLYARLSAAEQQRAFTAHRGRRVVLATNVAETSVTVPGIRYVVDPGTARISRYSARLKVQRLPIEPVSQASADQRKGRCGRTADGICIRLYSEEDFAGRPRYTDPEILRTNLAAVILQMAALGLGEIEDFGFLDPPDARQIRDGVNLLVELGALDPRATDPAQRLTDVGRRLSRLPVDPRLGRMVLEADARSCADEVIVIAAALSIQDPRERPADQRAQADQLHARFRDDTSDFLAFVNLWRHLHEQRRELSGNQFRKRLKAEYLHYLRVREWQDLASQLRSAAREAGVRLNRTPAEPADIHVALLAGLLSHVGVRDAAGREYLGARGARFVLSPGSALARRGPAWVMVSELVETNRLYGHTAAAIRPEWIEPLAAHLVKRSYGEPRWEKRRASVVATERVTLYGLPIVTGRTVGYGDIDPGLSRDLFLRRALVERDWDTRHRFFADNGRLLEEVEALEHRVRRRDILVDDATLYAFFDARIPASVVSGAHFDRWWKDERRRSPNLLTFTRELLVGDPEAATGGGRPQRWRQGELSMPLSYTFAPGTDADGVTVHVPLKGLPQLRAEDFAWQVPALREELVTALLRTLPKELRRPLVPLPDVAAELLARLQPRAEPLPEALSRELLALRGVRVAPGDWDLDRLPAHLRMRFRVEDEEGRVQGEGTDLGALRAALAPRLRAELTAAVPGLERHGLRAWELGDLPREVTLPGTGRAVRAFPALVDEGDAVGVRLLDSAPAQEQAMAAGTRRLLLLTVPSPARWVLGRLPGPRQLALSDAPHGSPAAVLADATAAAVDALVAQAGGPAWDAGGFARLRDHVAGGLAEATLEVVEQVAAILDARREVQRAAEGLTAAVYEPARLDVARQTGGLVFDGFITATGAARLPDVLRYLQGAVRRMQRLPDAVAVDRDRMAGVQELEQRRREVAARWRGRATPPALEQARWMLEELRMSHFAQGLGVHGQVSAKRVRRLLDEAAAAA